MELNCEIILRILFHSFINLETLACHIILSMKLGQLKHHTIQKIDSDLHNYDLI